VLDAVEELQPVSRQAVGSRPLAQQGQVAQRRVAVRFTAVGDIGDGRENPPVAILGLESLGPVAASGNSFGRIEAEQIAPCDLVENSPNFGLRVGP